MRVLLYRVIFLLCCLMLLGPVSGAWCNGAVFADPQHKINLVIISEHTEYDSLSNTVTSTGDAVAKIDDQDAKLEADTIVYDRNNEIIEGRGNVRITRKQMVTVGTSFKFKTASDEYLMTVPGCEIDDITIAARTSYPPAECRSINFTKDKVIPCFYGSNQSLYRPHHFALGPNNMWLYFSASSIYNSKFSNDLMHRPLTTSDWGRDRYGLGATLFGSPLNRQANFLGYADSHVLVRRYNNEPMSMFKYLEAGSLPIICESLERPRAFGVLRPVGQTERSFYSGVKNKMIWDRHDQVIEIFPADQIECPVICDYITLSSPLYRIERNHGLALLMAWKRREKFAGTPRNDISVEQHIDINSNGGAP